MSYIYKEGEPKKVVVKTVKEVQAVQCDKCFKAIMVENGMHDSNRYFEVMIGHHGWGNDSCDSIKHFDICPNCIGGFVVNYLDKAKGTAYIDVNVAYAYPREESV